MGNPTGGTAAAYEAVAGQADDLLRDARAQLPDDAVVEESFEVDDLDEDRHRLLCSDGTSQYRNILRLQLADGADEIAFIDGLRDGYVEAGWQRSPSVDEQAGREQDPEGRYAQVLRGPDGFGLTIGRLSEGAALELVAYSPCIADPADRPSTWGL